MKKSLIGFLASLGCLACLAGCGTTGTDGLTSAKDYVKELYKSESTETGADYDRAGIVKIGGVDYTVEWSVNVDSITVSKNDDGDWVIDVPDEAEEAIEYVLTATIKDANGNTETLTYNYTVPKFRELTWAEFTAAEDDKAVVIKGVIGGIVNTDSKHELYLQDADGGYYVYNLDVAQMEGLEIGTEIRVRGTRDTYYGVNQVIKATVEILNAEPVDVVAEDVTEAFVAAESTKDEALYALQSKLITIKGVTVLGQDASDSTYYNFKLDDKKTYVRISSSACMFDKDDQDAFIAAVAENKGMLADVTGFISIYNNAVYIIPQTKDAFSNFQAPNLTDAEKIDYVMNMMNGVASKLTATVTLETINDLFTATALQEAFADVIITWTSSNDAVAKVEGGKLVVTRPAMDAEDAEVVITASVACGEETAKTVEYTVVIPKMPSTLPLAISEAPVVDATYKMYLEQENLDKTLYLTGAMDGNYLAATEAQEDATNVIVKAGSADGKFYLFVENAAKYLTVTTSVKDAEKGTFYYNVSLTRDATTEFVWDATYETLVTDKEGDEKAFIGTYNKFETFSASKYSYLASGNFAARLCTLVPADQIPDEPVAEYTKMTIAEALAAAEGTKVELSGTVSEFYEVWSSYNNCSPYITDGTNKILVFRTSTKVGIGDVITVKGVVTAYNNVNQIAQNGSTVEITTAHVCSEYTEATCQGPAACVVCGTAQAGSAAVDCVFVDGVCKWCSAPEGVQTITASKTIAALISELGWTDTTTKQSFNLDDVVSVKIDGGSNTGKAYSGNHIRIYATDSPAGTMTISLAAGYELVSVTISAQTGTYAFLCVGDGTTDISNTTTAVSGSSVVLKSVKNGSDGKQVRVTAIEVVYKAV